MTTIYSDLHVQESLNFKKCRKCSSNLWNGVKQRISTQLLTRTIIPSVPPSKNITHMVITESTSSAAPSTSNASVSSMLQNFLNLPLKRELLDTTFKNMKLWWNLDSPRAQQLRAWKLFRDWPSLTWPMEVSQWQTLKHMDSASWLPK